MNAYIHIFLNFIGVILKSHIVYFFLQIKENLWKATKQIKIRRDAYSCATTFNCNFS